MLRPDFIKDYLLKKFPNGSYQSNGTELVIPSLFLLNDWKCHMSINTETGLWQDFKTGKKGNFIHLFSWIEKIPYKKAHQRLQVLNLFLDTKIEQVEEIKQEKKAYDLSTFTKLSDYMLRSQTSPIGEAALYYANNRKILGYKDLMFCDDPNNFFHERLIIPFHNQKGEIIYIQARALSDTHKPKYLFPEENVNSFFKAGNILFTFDSTKHYVIVCEGALDAISLQIMGYNATAINGCHVSDTQLEMLAAFGGEIVLGLDNDESGWRGVESFEKARKRKGMPEFSILTPPAPHKDWNSVLVGEAIESVLLTNKVKYDYFYKIQKEISLL